MLPIAIQWIKTEKGQYRILWTAEMDSGMTSQCSCSTHRRWKGKGTTQAIIIRFKGYMREGMLDNWCLCDRQQLRI
jgi:hypothetical protein